MTKRVTGMLATSRSIDVHARGVEPGHHRPLEHPGRAARVTRGDDGVALAERGAVRHRETCRELGRDVDVRQPGDAVASEERPRSPRLPDDRRVDDGTGLDGLERVHLHARGEHAVLADEALVAEHDALLEPCMPTDVARPPHHRATEASTFADVRVVVDDDALEIDVAAHPHVGAEHGVLAEPSTGFDAAARTDDRGPDDLRVGMRPRRLRRAIPPPRS